MWLCWRLRIMMLMFGEGIKCYGFRVVMIKWFKKKWMMKLCFTFTAFSLDCNEHKSFYKPAIRPPWKYYGWSKYAQMSFLHLYNILCRYFIKKIIQRKGDKFHRQQMFCIQPHDDIDRNVKKQMIDSLA